MSEENGVHTVQGPRELQAVVREVVCLTTLSV